MEFDFKKWYNKQDSTRFRREILMKKNISEDLIVKSNYLIEAPCKLTITEQRIIYVILRMINRNDEDFKNYEFIIDDFIKMLGLKGQSAYSELKSITRQLRSRTFSIKFNDKKLINIMDGITEMQTGWVSNVSYKQGQGKIIFNLDPKLKPFLLQLKEKFTELDFNNLKQLKSIYSTQLYELLKQYEKLGERKFTLDELKKILSVEDNKSYNIYNNFKQKVILKAQEELAKKTDIYFEFEEVKKGRKVFAIKFTINKQQKDNDCEETKQLDIEDVSTSLDLDIKDIITCFKEKYNGNLNHDLTSKMLEKYGVSHVMYCMEEYKKYFIGRNIKNVCGDFYTFVTKGYEKPISRKGNLPKYADFDQREYDEGFYEQFYSNFNKID
jgi:plasmid replication initiation protein